MNSAQKLCLISAFISIPIYLICQHGPIIQDSAYHNFADCRLIFCVPNFWNVFSNTAFLFVGFLGLNKWYQSSQHKQLDLLLFSTSMILIGLGSAYYHLTPNNQTLVWDRLPMTIAFMSFFSCIIKNLIHKKTGEALTIPFVALGIISVLYWANNNSSGHGDLRLYIIVQYLPMLLIPLITLLYKSSHIEKSDIIIVLALYSASKAFEFLDSQIFQFYSIISGHTLKHLCATIGSYWALRLWNNTTPENFSKPPTTHRIFKNTAKPLTQPKPGTFSS